jgi:NarL family two-component system response regulator YdfI
LPGDPDRHWDDCSRFWLTQHGRGMIRVFIRASSPVLRAGLESLIHAYPSLHIVNGSFPDSGYELGHQTGIGDDATADTESDVVLAEIENRDDDNAKETLEDAANGVPVILLVHGPAREWAYALRQGVRAVLPSNVTAAQVAAAIEAAVAGLVVLHPGEVEGLIASRGTNESSEVLPEALTPREIDVLRLLAEGRGNKEIGSQLGISEHTVKFHVASIMGKLGAASRTEAVTLGIRHGIVLI